jgi:hypothetical protein
VPYFEQLRDELATRKHLNRANEEVTKLGFDEKAVKCMSSKDSVIQAICAWLGDRKHQNPATLRNVYSRVHGLKERS